MTPQTGAYLAPSRSACGVSCALNGQTYITSLASSELGPQWRSGFTICNWPGPGGSEQNFPLLDSPGAEAVQLENNPTFSTKKLEKCLGARKWWAVVPCSFRTFSA